MKKFCLIACILISFLISVDAFSYQSRLDDRGINRVIDISPEIYSVATENDIPLDLLAGIIYNESNARPFVIGDAGYAFSLTQIRCATDGRRFSWMPFLRKKGVNIQKCSDLLDVKMSLKSTAIILRHHYEREKNWENTVKAFHLGFNWRSDMDRVNGYLRRVKYFGRNLENIIELNGRYHQIVSKLDSWLENKIVKVKKIYNFYMA